MKHYKTVHRPAREEQMLDFLVCDICGRKSDSGWGDWRTKAYDATEVVVKLRLGDDYPEGGSGEKWEIDICPECFREKLIPWVEAFGHTKIEAEEWAW